MAERKLPSGVPEAFRALMKKPVSFFPALARLCGSATAGLFLSQAIFWDGSETVIERTPLGSQRWFWKSAKEWERETCLSTREQQTARTNLKSKGFISEKLVKIDGSPVVHFLVNIDAIIEAHIAACSGETNTKMDLAIPTKQAPNGFGDSDKTMDLAERPNETPDLAKMDISKTPNAIRKEAETRSRDKRLDTKEGEAPPASLTISREKMMRNLTTEPGKAPDREVMEAVHRARAAGGLDASQAKAYLGTFMNWKLWPYWEQIDAQQQISFPEPPPKPQPRPLPADFRETEGFNYWERIRDHIKKRTSPHSYETWVKPIKSYGIWRGVLYLRVPTPEFKRAQEKFSQAIAESMNGLRDIKFFTPEDFETCDWKESA